MVRVIMYKKYSLGDQVNTKFGLGEVVNVIPGDRGCPTFYEVEFVLGKKTFTVDEISLVEKTESDNNGTRKINETGLDCNKE